MHLLNFKDWSSAGIRDLIDKAIHIKNNPREYRAVLEAKSLAMIFQKTSTRTRVSFEVAMTQLGGHALYMDWRTTNFTLADIEDETNYLSRNVDGIMARMLRHKHLEAMAGASLVPVINGCCEKYHPSQAVADLMTMKERKGYLEGLRLVYIGIHNNVCNSLIEACTKLGIEITTVTPLVNEPSIDKQLIKTAENTGLYKKSSKAKEAVKEADFVYTDTWIDMEFFTEPKYKPIMEERIRIMRPYQVNSQLLQGSNALVMHDMPIHRGYEISGEVIQAKNSIIYEQAKNRLYSAKSILINLLS